VPFPHQNPRPFTRQEVEGLHPGLMGCYGLFGNGVWVYVGKGDLRARLLGHLNGEDQRISALAPTHWVGETTPDMDNEEQRLILELKPACNA
jgi:hypothetical protein